MNILLGLFQIENFYFVKKLTFSKLTSATSSSTHLRRRISTEYNQAISSYQAIILIDFFIIR